MPHVVLMNDIIEQIRAREAAIQKEIDDLKDEARLWKLANSIYHHRHILLTDDAVNKRAAHKFAVLGEVVKYLTKNAHLRKNGDTAADIFHQISHQFPTMSPSTFRSQLTRFKAEGRLTYDDDKRTWNVAKREEEAP